MEGRWEARVVGRTPVGDWEVSTVFLGVDHAVPGTPGPRRLFETMIFHRGDGRAAWFCARYATWAEAATGHGAVVAWLEAGRLDPEAPEA
jgi:hypothetical protein